LRMIAIMAFGLLMMSAALGVWLPGMRTTAPRVLMGTGWILGIGALGTAFTAWQQVSAWTAAPRPSPDPTAVASPLHPAAAAAPWLLLGALALTGVSLLTAL
jgi:hypothetical protein